MKRQTVEARLHASVRGLVQGVSFRYYTLHRARELGLRGYVRNLWDGSVEVVAEGPRQSLEQLLTWLHQGHLPRRSIKSMFCGSNQAVRSDSLR